jgi:glycosyltransferase involved in cell wall biosynthesis
MKILYIANSRIPAEKAYSIQIMKMCEAFGLQNKEVELILPTRKNKKFKNISPFRYYSIKNKFKIKKIKTIDPVFLMKFPDGVYIKLQLIFFSIGLFFYLLFKRNKSKYIFYTRDEYLLPLLQKFSKKVIWEAHTLPNNTDRYISYWQKCHRIVTISEALKDELQKLNITQEKIIVEHDGVDLNNFQSLSSNSKTLGLPKDKKIVMYTGHLYDWKGVQTLVDAAQYLQDPSQVVFVGGIKSDVEKNKSNVENLTFIPHQPPDKIPGYLNAAHVLVLPNSKKDKRSYWTSPLKMFEYMASGKPIIASNLPSIREVLNENNAIFFKSDDPKDLAEKIKYVLNNPKIAETKANQAKKDIREYSWHKRAETILEFIK